MMFENIKSQLHTAAVQELLAYAVYPDPENVRKVLEQYCTDDSLELYGLKKEDELIGLVGTSSADQGQLTVKHIAVQPEYRGQGYGRGLMLELIALLQPKTIAVETDEESVDFYRNIGFTIVSLGEKYPGVERFHCVYEVEG